MSLSTNNFNFDNKLTTLTPFNNNCSWIFGSVNNNPNKSLLFSSLVNNLVLITEDILFDILLGNVGKNDKITSKLYRIVFKPKSLFSKFSEFLKQLYPNSIANSQKNFESWYG